MAILRFVRGWSSVSRLYKVSILALVILSRPSRSQHECPCYRNVLISCHWIVISCSRCLGDFGKGVFVGSCLRCGQFILACLGIRPLSYLFDDRLSMHRS